MTPTDPNANQDYVQLTREEYDHLCDREEKLSALEAGGVDNWEWYDESLSDYYANQEDERNDDGNESY